MSKFRITYPSGAFEIVEQSDSNTVEQFANIKFGSVDYVAAGVKVELISEENNVELDQGRDKEAGLIETGIGDSAGQEDTSENAEQSSESKGETWAESASSENA